jgi:hypothetical protein
MQTAAIGLLIFKLNRFKQMKPGKKSSALFMAWEIYKYFSEFIDHFRIFIDHFHRFIGHFRIFIDHFYRFIGHFQKFIDHFSIYQS